MTPGENWGASIVATENIIGGNATFISVAGDYVAPNITNQRKPTPKLSDDPFREYLRHLNEFLLQSLESEIFSEPISLGALDSSTNIRQRIPQVFQEKRVQLFAEKSKPVEFNTIIEAFTYYDGHLLLLGEPGAGKTISLRGFAFQKVKERLSDSTLPLPIYIQIYRWDGSSDLIAWIAKYSNLDVELLQREIEAQNVILFFDGLDELRDHPYDPNEGEFKPWKNRFDFMQLVSKLQNVQLVVTSRVDDYELLISKSQQKFALTGAITLQPPTDQQMDEYLKNQPDLLETIRADNNLRKLAKIPLWLNLLRFAYKHSKDKVQGLKNFDNSRITLEEKIFEICIAKRYEFEQARIDRPIPFSLEQIYDHLGYAVIASIADDYRDIDSNKHLSPTLNARRFDFAKLMTRLHVFSSGSNFYSEFTHLLIKDYFAIIYCLSRFQSSDAKIRSTIAKALGKLGDSRGIDILVKLLKDEEMTVRNDAAWSLALLEDLRGVEPLIDALKDAENRIKMPGIGLVLASLRLDIASQTIDFDKQNARFIHMDVDVYTYFSALVKLKALSLPFLIQAFPESQPSFQLGVLWILAEIADPQCSGLFFNTLDSDNENLKILAACGLGRIKARFAIPKLIMLFNNKNGSVNLRAMFGWALGVIGGSQSIDLITQSLKSVNRWISLCIIAGLGLSRDPYAIEPLLDILNDDVKLKELHISSVISCALAEIGTLKSLDGLIKLLGNKDSTTREYAARGLGRLRHPSAVEPLLELLRTEKAEQYEWEIYEIVNALRMIGNQEAMQGLLQVSTINTRKSVQDIVRKGLELPHGTIFDTRYFASTVARAFQ